MSWNTAFVFVPGDHHVDLPGWADQLGFDLQEPWDGAESDGSPGVHGDCTVLHDEVFTLWSDTGLLLRLAELAGARVVAVLSAGTSGIWGFRVVGKGDDRYVRVRDCLVVQEGTPVPEEAGWELTELSDLELFGWAAELGFEPEKLDEGDVWVVGEPPA